MKEIFIGIDPGVKQTGFSVLISENFNFYFYKSGTYFLNEKEKKRYSLIYNYFHEYFLKIKDEFKREKIYLCIESQFVFKNPKSTFVLISVKTIFLLLAEKFDFEIIELTPKEIKKISTGSGNSSKDLVQLFIKNYFNYEDFSSFDESDAMATSFASAIFKLNVL